MKIAAMLAATAIAIASVTPAQAQNTYQLCNSYNQSLTTTDNDIMFELLQRPFEAAALLGSLAGLSAFVDQQMEPDQRNVIIGIGVAGAIYCAWDEQQASSCARAAVTLTSLFVQRDQLMNGFNRNYCRQYFSR